MRYDQFFLDLMCSVAILLRMALPSFDTILDFSFRAFSLVSFLMILFFSSCCRLHLITLVPAVSCLGGLLWGLIFPPYRWESSLTPVLGLR